MELTFLHHFCCCGQPAGFHAFVTSPELVPGAMAIAGSTARIYSDAICNANKLVLIACDGLGYEKSRKECGQPGGYPPGRPLQIYETQMAAVQATIPFRSRKKVSIVNKSKKYKADAENWDHLNTTDHNKLKRRMDRSKSDCKQIYSKDDEGCSPTKIARTLRKATAKQSCKVNESTKKSVTTEERLKPLPSRETEIEWLETFLTEHLDKGESGSLYVSGQPGTGKTASLSYILQLPKIKEEYTQVYVNCTMVKSAASIYNRICKELKIRTSGSTEKACLTAIEKYLAKKHKMILLVLDEIDQLDSKRQSVLYTVFEWPAFPKSRLVLIGVANALDLTERALPRLQARCSLRPRTLHFAPYTKQQIINIFTTILAAEDKSSVFSPVALQMLAAKISAISGDMRRAFDIGRRVIEVAKRNKFSENKSVDSMLKDSAATVELKQVLEVLNDVYGGSTKIETDVDAGFPLQQKLILCSLLLMLTRGKNRDVLAGKLHDVYKRVALVRNIAPLDLSELLSACTLLEARGALRVAGGGAGGARAKRLRLQWDEAELTASLRDKPLMAAILNDTQCLGS